jgi:hypothetical protein
MSKFRIGAAVLSVLQHFLSIFGRSSSQGTLHFLSCKYLGGVKPYPMQELIIGSKLKVRNTDILHNCNMRKTSSSCRTNYPQTLWQCGRLHCSYFLLQKKIIYNILYTYIKKWVFIGEQGAELPRQQIMHTATTAAWLCESETKTNCNGKQIYCFSLYNFRCFNISMPIKYNDFQMRQW